MLIPSSTSFCLLPLNFAVNRVTPCPAAAHLLSTSCVKTSAPPISGFDQHRQLKTKIFSLCIHSQTATLVRLVALVIFLYSQSICDFNHVPTHSEDFHEAHHAFNVNINGQLDDLETSVIARGHHFQVKGITFHQKLGCHSFKHCPSERFQSSLSVSQ